MCNFKSPSSHPCRSFQPGPPPNTLLVPTSGTPVIIDDSRVKARKSSGSRSWTSALPQERASIWISAVKRIEQIHDTVGCGIHFQTRHELRILSRDSNRAAPRVAMVAGVRFCSQLVIVLEVDRFVAIESDESGRAQIDSISTESEGFCRIGTAANTAGNNQLHLAVKADILKAGPGFTNGGQCRNSCMFEKNIRRGARSRLPFHPPQSRPHPPWQPT